MKINDVSEINWTEKVESTSSVRDPLGLWSHLNIQTDYIPGITSVTNRIRYYSLLAWYYDKLLDKRILTTTEFERVFILTCLSHHNGDYGHDSLGHVFNKMRFKDDWTTIKKFKLDFPINGFGRTYYNRQLEVLRCCWTDVLNQVHKSPINSDLISHFPEVDADFFSNKEFTKELIIENFKDFCICKKYDHEIEVMTELLFGFIKNKGNDWNIDEESYNSFMQNKGIDLDFKGYELNTEEGLISSQDEYQEMSQRRRNTLLMFLKIIHENQPATGGFRKAIFDALYFKQKSLTHEKIDFKNLEKAVSYWEFLQLGIYYVYSIEMIFDIVQELVHDESGIRKDKMFASLDENLIFDKLKNMLGNPIDNKTTVKDVKDILYGLSDIGKGLENSINESVLYDKIRDSDELEDILAYSLLMLLLLKRKYATISKDIIDSARINKSLLIEDKLRIDILFTYLDANENNSLSTLFEYLIKNVIDRHLYESAVRMSWGTKNWLFVEEDGRLFFSKGDMISIHTRDNRWDSTLSMMKDIEMVKSDTKVTLTEKGEKWLQLAKLI